MTLSALLSIATALQQGTDGDFLFPPQASTVAGAHDWVFYMLTVVAGISFALICAATVWFAWRYRSSACPEPQESTSHSTFVELIWTFVPTIFLVYLFWVGMDRYVDFKAPPVDAYEIKATAQKWNWNFTYPDGTQHNELHVPVDTDVRILIESRDVLHSLFVPAFRVKMDAVPGRYTDLWFNATKTGTYHLFCTEYCGMDHAAMITKAVVHEKKGFDNWLKENGDLLAIMTPLEAGEKFFTMKGCVACHSLDGTDLVGPSLKGTFGTERELTDGTKVVMDENYIRKSILEPQAELVAGFPPTMPTFQGQLKDAEIDAVIEFIKAQN